MKDDRVYLNRIIASLDRIEEEAAKGELAFRNNPTLQDAVLMNLAVIGEAVKAVSEATRARAEEIPWREIARLRDIIVHRYHSVDLDEIWDIVRLDVLPLKARIEALKAELSDAAERR